MGRGRLAGVVVLALAFTLLAMPASRAATVEVSPGPNAIQNAVNAAAAGGTLLIHAGTYNESVTVSKFGLHLQAYGDGP
jgi:polygalacturonase